MTDHITIDDVDYTITQDGVKLILEPVKLPAEPNPCATVLIHNVPYYHAFTSKNGWSDPWGNRYSWRELCDHAAGDEVRRVVSIPLGWKALAVPEDYEITDATDAPDDDPPRWQPLYPRDHLVPAPVKRPPKLLVTGYIHDGPTYELTLPG